MRQRRRQEIVMSASTGSASTVDDGSNAASSEEGDLKELALETTRLLKGLDEKQDQAVLKWVTNVLESIPRHSELKEEK